MALRRDSKCELQNTANKSQIANRSCQCGCFFVQFSRVSGMLACSILPIISPLSSFRRCHVSHYQLTELLLPDLLSADGAAGEVRVVTTSSSAHAFPATLELGDLNWDERTWDATAAYGTSKLANMLFAQELAQRQPLDRQALGSAKPRLRSLAVHPGVVATSLFREFGASSLDDLAEQTPLGLVLKRPAEGCRPLVYALLAPGLPTGAYVSDCELTDVSPAAKDASARVELWEWTERWIAEARAKAELAKAEVALKSESGTPNGVAEEVAEEVAEKVAEVVIEEENDEESLIVTVEPEESSDDAASTTK